MQPLLLSRFMFSLREAYLSEQAGDTSSSLGSRYMSTVRFTANIVGNMGAPLTDSELLEYADDDREPPPVTCDDPFAVGLIKNEAVGPAYVVILCDAVALTDDIIAENNCKGHRPPNPQPTRIPLFPEVQYDRFSAALSSRLTRRPEDPLEFSAYSSRLA